MELGLFKILYYSLKSSEARFKMPFCGIGVSKGLLHVLQV